MIKYHWDVIQRTEEWLALRMGLLTASDMKLIITPKKLEYAQNDKEKAHLDELAAQRVNKYAEPTYQSYDMLRGLQDEPDSKFQYEKHYAPIKDCGFVTNDKWGFTLGMSPDGLVGDEGQVECKGRRQHFQLRTIVDNKMPEDFLIQVQCGLLITERKWCDFISYCGGMMMDTIRVYPDPVIMGAIEKAAIIFHEKMDKLLAQYSERLADKTMRLIPTERRPEESEIIV